MTDAEKLIPASSQTVGPFFSIGLEYLMDRARAVNSGNHIEIRGRVLDGNGIPVPDAVLEFWSPSVAAAEHDFFPAGFRRVATDVGGNFAVKAMRPEASHMLVLVFARGLLRHLLTRVYFHDTVDAVLQQIPAERRGTLMAQLDGEQTYRWDVILQGENETVFFAW
jgi:protocatechuate 3,4-dioxygenase alpha subunit